jgi:RHS repeat-associated protein
VIAGYPKTKIKQLTHNGATATGTTHVYTGPVTVGKCNVMFFEARAYKSGMTDSVVTTYNADYTGAPTCGGAKLFSDDATLSGSDSASDYQLVAYTGGSSARNKARQSISDRLMRRDAAAYMSDRGFMRVALNSSSPTRSGKTTALPSTSVATTVPRGATVIYSVWDGDWAILEEYDNTGARVQGYVEGYHGLVKTLADNIYYYQDELGSTSHVADANGALLEYYKYNLYGKPTYWNAANTQIPSSNYQVQDLGNGGSRWIPQLGLYDDRNRFMSPDLGRFLQPDPIGFKGDSSNLYRYCGNDWANKTDPLGLDIEIELRYYNLGSAPIQGTYAHQNLVVTDTVTGRTIVERGFPRPQYESRGWRGALNLPEKGPDGKVKTLQAQVYSGNRKIDPISNEKTKLVPGSKMTLPGNLDTAKTKLERLNGQIERANITYRPQTTNSNAAAAAGYRELSGQQAPISQKIPGSGTDLRPAMGQQPEPRMSSPPLPPPPQASTAEPPDIGGEGFVALGGVFPGFSNRRPGAAP